MGIQSSIFPTVDGGGLRTRSRSERSLIWPDKQCRRTQSSLAARVSAYFCFHTVTHEFADSGGSPMNVLPEPELGYKMDLDWFKRQEKIALLGNQTICKEFVEFV
eukprot:737213_1